ncbi:histidine phosphatase family protein [Cronobacter dublinensis]|uniref:histidine phosphatase family protein n=1 Tax=Cronobacter dublinensis TaxID=413497 RepID=UPI0029D7DD33|nr:histidine phosphatase family protein [Cronobacter dublinensis]
MHLILIRHAETAWNRGGLIQGHQDSALTARGLQETTALLTAWRTISRRLTGCTPRLRAAHVIWVPPSRAHFGCPTSVEPLAQEQAFGDYEGLSRAPRLVPFIQDTDLSFSTSRGK